MIAPVAIALIGAMLHVVSPSDSGDCSVRSAGVTGNSVSAADVGIQQGGPREHRIAFSIESRTADEHALLDTTIGKSHRRDAAHAPGLRGVTVLACVSVSVLAALSLIGLWLPGSALVDALGKGIS